MKDKTQFNEERITKHVAPWVWGQGREEWGVKEGRLGRFLMRSYFRISEKKRGEDFRKSSRSFVLSSSRTLEST